jgi:hypothetical protein
MAYHFEFDSTNQVLCCRFSGHVSSQFMEKFSADARQHAARLSPRAVVFDFSTVTSSEVLSSAVLALAEAPPIVPDAACPRVVVAPAPLIFGLARMFQIRGESTRPRLEVVRSLAEARTLLNVQDLHFELIDDQ